MQSSSLYDALERMAQYGTAPDEACGLFGVGLDDPLARLKKVYFENSFARGKSAEKFVVGPFGSGKTHFLRQLQEVAHGADCAVAEVQLNRDVDFTNPLAVYQEIAAEIHVPNQPAKGLQNLLRYSAERLRASVDDDGVGLELLLHFIQDTGERVFELECLGRMYARAFRALVDGETEHFELVCRWLAGNFGDRPLCKRLGEAPISPADHRRYGHKAALSLYQLIKSLGFTGTLVCLDEAEQSLDVDRKRMQTILSTLQSSINAVADLKEGAALIVFAITPDVADKLKEFPALQQRLIDPGPGMGFFSGRNTRTPLIDLSERQDKIEEELLSIASNLVKLYADSIQTDLTELQALEEKCRSVALEVAASEVGSSIRRTLTKQVCFTILSYDDGDWSATPEREEEV